MKKREIIETVNKVHIWEKDSKLLDLLVQDGRLPKRFNAWLCLSVPPPAIQRDRRARLSGIA